MISFPTILLRLILALVLGAIVGLEREGSEHTAGMRTNALVALGSSLFTIISAFGFLSLTNITHVQIDPTRIASYVVAGIGFLGGGVIFRQSNEGVKGLTTAAAIWMVAAIGMACGAGFLWESVIATALALIVLIVLRRVETLLLPHKRLSGQDLYIEVTSVSGQFLSNVYDTCTKAGVTIKMLKVGTEEGIEHIKIECRVPNPATLAHTVGELRSLPGVRAVHANLHNMNSKNSSA